jgi:hypothetical protein
MSSPAHFGIALVRPIVPIGVTSDHFFGVVEVRLLSIGGWVGFGIGIWQSDIRTFEQFGVAFEAPLVLKGLASWSVRKSAMLPITTCPSATQATHIPRFTRENFPSPLPSQDRQSIRRDGDTASEPQLTSSVHQDAFFMPCGKPRASSHNKTTAPVLARACRPPYRALVLKTQ